MEAPREVWINSANLAIFHSNFWTFFKTGRAFATIKYFAIGEVQNDINIRDLVKSFPKSMHYYLLVFSIY